MAGLKCVFPVLSIILGWIDPRNADNLVGFLFAKIVLNRLVVLIHTLSAANKKNFPRLLSRLMSRIPFAFFKSFGACFSFLTRFALI